MASRYFGGTILFFSIARGYLFSKHKTIYATALNTLLDYPCITCNSAMQLYKCVYTTHYVKYIVSSVAVAVSPNSFFDF